MVEPFHQQDRDQGCPNLDAQGVFAGAHEALYFEILLERLEKLNDILPINNALLKSRSTTTTISCAGLLGFPSVSRQQVRDACPRSPRRAALAQPGVVVGGGADRADVRLCVPEVVLWQPACSICLREVYYASRRYFFPRPVRRRPG